MRSKTIDKGGVGQADPMEKQMKDLLDLVQSAVGPVEPTRGQEGVLIDDWVEIVRDWLRELREDLLGGDCDDATRELLECQAENRRLRRREMRMIERLARLQGVDRRNKRLRAALAKVRSDSLAELEADRRAAGNGGGRA